jgi:hypothetical protein
MELDPLTLRVNKWMKYSYLTAFHIDMENTVSLSIKDKLIWVKEDENSVWVEIEINSKQVQGFTLQEKSTIKIISHLMCLVRESHVVVIDEGKIKQTIWLDTDNFEEVITDFTFLNHQYIILSN